MMTQTARTSTQPQRMRKTKTRGQSAITHGAMLDIAAVHKRIAPIASSAAASQLMGLVHQYHQAGISLHTALYAAQQTAGALGLRDAKELSYLDTLRIQRYYGAVVRRKAPFDAGSQDFHNRQFLQAYVQRMQKAGWSNDLIRNTLLTEYQSYLSPAMHQEFIEPLAQRQAA